MLSLRERLFFEYFCFFWFYLNDLKIKCMQMRELNSAKRYQTNPDFLFLGLACTYLGL